MFCTGHRCVIPLNLCLSENFLWRNKEGYNLVDGIWIQMGSYYKVQLREKLNICWTSEIIERGSLNHSGIEGLTFGMTREFLFDVTSRIYF
jgi:hypothetical protein